MRRYLRQRRLAEPAKELWARARQRAEKFGLAFTIEPDQIFIPQICPAVGLPLKVGGPRSANSPSLDRIEPSLGYVPGNVRVISDHANRLKGNRNMSDLTRLASHGSEALREDYRRLHSYVEREALLAQVRQQAGNSRQHRSDWQRLAVCFERLCERGLYEA